jgi:hypothetical protein
VRRIARILLLSLYISVSYCLAGCGSESSSTTTTAAESWANGACSALTDYKTAVTTAVSSVQAAGLSEAALQTAAKSISSATDTLVSSVKSLGVPNTAGGDQVKQALDTLTTQLQQDVDELQAAAKESSPVDALTKASATLTKAKGQLTTAADALKSADAKGELKDAFDTAPACADLRKDTKKK